MRCFALLSTVLFSGLTLFPVRAAALVPSAAFPDRAANNVQMIYSVQPAKACFDSAQTGTELKYGLEHCDIALRDPLMNYRGQTVVNRGIIRYAMGDADGAMADFAHALDFNPTLGDAYLNKALVLIYRKEPDQALAAINQGIALGSANLQIAYYARGMIEDDAGHYEQAYRDYRQAVRIKPDYQPALRELERFKTVPKGADS
jgi:tetratricopeptide (TPR) repeat protein